MKEEKLKILEMIQAGKVNAVEGLELLEAPQESEPREEPAHCTGAKRCLRVKVNDSTGAKKVDVKIPMNLVKIATKFAGTAFIPDEARAEMSRKGIDLSQVDFEELIRMIDEGLSDGRLVDVDVEDPKDGRVRVEVYVE